MNNKTLKELGKIMNEELKAKDLNITVEVKGSDSQGILTNVSGKDLEDEAKKYQEAMSIAFEKWKKKHIKEF